jgi:hypothetical protein
MLTMTGTPGAGVVPLAGPQATAAEQGPAAAGVPLSPPS